MPTLPEQVQAVKEMLRGKVFRAELPPGARIHEEDLRAETGATVRAVRAALRDLTGDGLLSRKRRQGTCVALRLPESVGATLPALTSVGILSALTKKHFEAPGYPAAVLNGIRQALSGAHGRVQLLAHERRARRDLDELPVVRPELLRSTLQGVIGIEANNAQVLNDLVRAGLAVVAVDFWHPQAIFDVAAVDHQAAGHLATAHLLALGHRRVGYIGEAARAGSTDPTWQQRLSGYMLAMSEVSREAFGRWIVDVRRDTARVPAALPAFHRAERPTAYVLGSGELFPPVLQELERLGLRCPGDVSLSAADSAYPATENRSLSCARVEYEQLGQSALRLLASRAACRAMPPVRTCFQPVFRAGTTSRALEA